MGRALHTEVGLLANVSGLSTGFIGFFVCVALSSTLELLQKLVYVKLRGFCFGVRV